MNSPQLDGTIRHALNTIGTLLLALSGFSFLPEGIREFLTPESISGGIAAIMGIVGALGTAWAFIKSFKSPEKAIVSPSEYRAAKGR